MTRIFADTCYWIALLNRNDQLHAAARAAQKKLAHAQVVTTDEVLGEVLNFFSGRGLELRATAANIVDAIRIDPHVRVIQQSRSTFDAGLGLYKLRPDKEYSFVDCVSFAFMAKDGIKEALTNDLHFVQEGFVAVLRPTKS